MSLVCLVQSSCFIVVLCYICDSEQTNEMIDWTVTLSQLDPLCVDVIVDCCFLLKINYHFICCVNLLSSGIIDN